MAHSLTIVLNGKTYTAPRPKVKLWRQIAKFKDQNEGKDILDVLDEMETLICAVFNHPDVTPEALEENLDLDELLPMFQRVVEFVNSTVSEKVQQLPNSTTPATN